MPTDAGQSDGLSEGELFAGHTIVRRLGAGGMGKAYPAQHPGCRGAMPSRSCPAN
ncbi:putative anchored-membrane serine/threonine-protein kinase [Mycobacterium kansasii 732]|nr:putative anchored-membrane serine/threonine-protein kinase [Mycobacterium kansasii 732]